MIPNELLYQAIGLVLSIILTVAMNALRKWLFAKYTAEQVATARTIAEDAMRFVEQTVKNVKGEGKLNAAIDNAKQFAAGYGLTLTDAQWKTLIESAVRTMNDWSKPPVAPETSGQ